MIKIKQTEKCIFTHGIQDDFNNTQKKKRETLTLNIPHTDMVTEFIIVTESLYLVMCLEYTA